MTTDKMKTNMIDDQITIARMFSHLQSLKTAHAQLYFSGTGLDCLPYDRFFIRPCGINFTKLEPSQNVCQVYSKSSQV